MTDRLTQEAVEVLEGAGSAKARLTQEAVEVLHQRPTLAAGLTQLAVEVLVPSSGYVASGVLFSVSVV